MNNLDNEPRPPCLFITGEKMYKKFKEVLDAVDTPGIKSESFTIYFPEGWFSNSAIISKNKTFKK